MPICESHANVANCESVLVRIIRMFIRIIRIAIPKVVSFPFSFFLLKPSCQILSLILPKSHVFSFFSSFLDGIKLTSYILLYVFKRLWSTPPLKSRFFKKYFLRSNPRCLVSKYLNVILFLYYTTLQGRGQYCLFFSLV